MPCEKAGTGISPTLVVIRPDQRMAAVQETFTETSPKSKRDDPHTAIASEPYGPPSEFRLNSRVARNRHQHVLWLWAESTQIVEPVAREIV